jgi:hypothetical protein
VWAEPYNDRHNWQQVRTGYAENSPGYRRLTCVFGQGGREAWSPYATELYVRLRSKAREDGWLHKLRYLLYEKDITRDDAKQFAGLEGVLLQSKPDSRGLSKNPYLAELQQNDKPIGKSSPNPTLWRTVVSESEVVEVPVDQIIESSRIRRLDRRHVERLAEVPDGGLPPIRVSRAARDRFVLVDGCHRLEACRVKGQATVEAVVLRYEPGAEGRRWFALDQYRFNRDHGLPLSRRDRDRAIVRLWARWGEGKGLTLEELGRAFGLTKQRVGQILSKGSDSPARPAARSFSAFSKFQSALKRLSGQLDPAVVKALVAGGHGAEVREGLVEVLQAVTLTVQGLEHGDRR